MKKVEENNSNKTNIKIILVLVVAIIAVCSVFYFKDNNPFKHEDKADLKYTESTDKIKEGIYITDVSEVVENVMPSIVAITSKKLVSSGLFGPSYYGSEQYVSGAGSGIIISKNDDNLMILTNNHVVSGADELSVQFINKKSYDAKVLGTSVAKDIAVITISLKDLDNETKDAIKIATLGNSDSLKVGSGVIAIGNALGYGQSVTTGVVSALNRKVSGDEYNNEMIQIDAAINGGNSGGALLNARGEVVGVNSAKYSSNSLSSASIEGMGFAIPISDVGDTIKALMNGEEAPGDVAIGVEGYIITEQESKYYNIPAGFYVSKISNGGGADKAGISVGNIIAKIEGKQIASNSDINEVLKNKKKGDKINLGIYYPTGKEYAEKEISVTLS